MDNLQDHIHNLLVERDRKIAEDIRQNPTTPYPVIAKRHHCTPSVVQFVARMHGIQRGTLHIGTSATTKIKRQDFGLLYNRVVEGAAVVGDEVQITIDAELLKAANSAAASK
jgi:hypothetical protein